MIVANSLSPTVNVVNDPAPILVLAGIHPGVRHHAAGNQVQRHIAAHHPLIDGLQDVWKESIVVPGLAARDLRDVIEREGVVGQDGTVSDPILGGILKMRPPTPGKR